MNIATASTVIRAREVARALGSSPESATVETLTTVLQLVDDLTAGAVRMIGDLAARRVTESSGLSADMAVRLNGRRTSWDAADLIRAATTLEAMPRLAAAFAENVVSWSQARAICRAVRHLDAAERADCDALVASLAPRRRRAGGARLTRR